MGIPTVKDFSNYNINNEIFITKIESHSLSIPVHISIAKEEVQKLKTKSLKPEVIFEYKNGKLSILKAVARFENKVYSIKILNLSDYDKSFILNNEVLTTSILWGDREVNNKIETVYIKEKSKPVLKPVVIKKKKQKLKKSNKITPDKAAIEICQLYKLGDLDEIMEHSIKPVVITEKQRRKYKNMSKLTAWYDCSNLTIKERFNFWWVYSNKIKTGMNFRINEEKNTWEY